MLVLIFLFIIFSLVALVIIVDNNFCYSISFLYDNVITQRLINHKKRIFNQKYRKNTTILTDLYKNKTKIGFKYKSLKFLLPSYKFKFNLLFKGKLSFIEQKLIDDKQLVFDLYNKVTSYFIAFHGRVRVINGKNYCQVLSCFCVREIFNGKKFNPIKFINCLFRKKKIFKYEVELFYYFFTEYLLILLFALIKEVKKDNRKILRGFCGRVNLNNIFNVYGCLIGCKKAGNVLGSLSSKQIHFATRQVLVEYELLDYKVRVILNWLRFLHTKRFI